MKLLGIEIFNYAGLSQQYLPLAERVQILAGRNNIGKSALLHALAAFGNSDRFKAYAGSSTLVIGVVFEAEAGELSNDFCCLLDHASNLKNVSGIYRLVSDFSKGSPSGPVKLLEVLPIAYDQWLPLLTLEQDNTYRDYYYYENHTQRYRRTTSQIRGQMSASILTQLTQFLYFTSYIDPHRKIEHGRPATEHVELPTNGAMLPQFLLTLQGKDHKRFADIEQTFLDCFPEYSKVLVPLSGSSISISLAERETDKEIPIVHCGTGVEQMLVLIASILGAPDERTFLLDEPQDFLHPFLERRLMSIIFESKHRFVICTHSATLINSVPADQVTLIEKPGQGFHEYSKPLQMRAELLRTLGYRNSDLMFFDGAVFVEGKSDVELVPQLLRKADSNAQRALRDVCFCDLGGTRDYSDFDSLKEDLIIQEKLITSLHRSRLPHVYLFDGDKSVAESRIKQTKPANEKLNFTFLERSEIENYLLDPVAITAALNYERNDRGLTDKVLEENVAKLLKKLMTITRKEDPSLFKRLYKVKGAIRSAIKDIQGSRVLEVIYGEFSMTYNKLRSGQVIAQFVTLDDDASRELKELVERLLSDLKLPNALS